MELVLEPDFFFRNVLIAVGELYLCQTHLIFTVQFLRLREFRDEMACVVVGKKTKGTVAW